MFRTACIFVALALCAATAPPRISLELAAGHSRTQLADSVSTQYGGNLASHDYAQECEASNNQTGTDCKFPIAKAFDSQDGVIAVTAAIMLLDSDGVQSNTPVNFTTVPQDAATLINPSTTASAIKTRSTYLFNYDASDSAGNMAEQVTFALVFNDITAPAFANSDGSSSVPSPLSWNAEFGDFNVLQSVREVACFDNVDGDIHVGKSVAVSAFAGSPCTTLPLTDEDALNRCSDAHTNLVLYGTDKTITVTAVCHDHAGIYGENGQNNVDTKAWTITLVDTTPPVIIVAANQTIECNKYEATAQAAQTPAVCYDNAKNVEWSHTPLPSINAAAIMVNKLTENANVGGDMTNDWPSSSWDTPLETTTTYTCNDGHNSPVNQAVSETQKFTIVDTTPPNVNVTYNGQVGTTAVSDGHVGTDGTRKINNNTNTVNHMITPHGDDVADVMAACCQGTIDGTSCTPDFSFTPHNGRNSSTCKAAMADATVAWTCDSSASCQITENIGGIHIQEMFTVTDACSDSFGYKSEWKTNGNQFEASRPGLYVRTYTIMDRSGHETVADITIKLQDPDAPIVQMIGCDSTYHAGLNRTSGCVNHIDATPSAGDICVAGVQAIDALQYEDQGASCHDFVDGSLSHAVEVSGQVVDMKIPGTYLIHYDCQDLSGNRAETSIRTVIIFDTTAPHITMGGSAENYVEAGFPFQLAATTCSDCLDPAPNLTDITTRFAGEETEACTGCDAFVTALNEDEHGTAAVFGGITHSSKYLVTYTCADKYENTVSKSRTITVKDTLPPVITLHNAAGTMEAQGGNGVSAHHHEGPEHNGLTNGDLSTKLELNPAHNARNTDDLTSGSNPNVTLMAESSSVNGWLIAAVASAVTGVALLGFSSKRTNQVMVPV